MYLIIGVWCFLATVWVDSPMVRVLLALVGLCFYSLAAQKIITKHKVAQAKSNREVEKEKTRALEVELGFEPINFHELTDEQVNQMYDEMKKRDS